MERILVGTDASAPADAAVEAAAELAEGRGAELLVLYVERPLDAREVFDPEGAPDAARYLAGLRDRLGEVRTRTRRLSGDPVETICEVARQESCDLIVLGRRPGRGRRITRSLRHKVMDRASCPVLVVDSRRAS